MNPMVKPASMERRNRVLDAGMALVLRNGLRGTTMEALAREAGIAKPTLYAYYPDKGAVFAAIAQRLFKQLRTLVSEQLERQGAPEARIAGALAAKHKTVFRLLEGSPHAGEIYGDKGRFAPLEVAGFEDWLEQNIALLLRDTGHGEPVKFSQLIIACAEGIACRAKYAEQIGPAIRLVCQRLLD